MDVEVMSLWWPVREKCLFGFPYVANELSSRPVL